MIASVDMSDTTISFSPAREVSPGDWVVEQVRIDFPDGSYDVGASGVRARSKADAERLAVSKAEDRWSRIIDGLLFPSHPKP
jgi:hypothetical protein